MASLPIHGLPYLYKRFLKYKVKPNLDDNQGLFINRGFIESMKVILYIIGVGNVFISA